MSAPCTAYRNRYTGKLYERESLCLRDEFNVVLSRAHRQLNEFGLYMFVPARNDDKFQRLWNLLKTLRELDSAFVAAVQRERVSDAENVVKLVRAQPADTLVADTEEGSANG